MNIPSALSQVLDFFGSPLVIEPPQGQESVGPRPLDGLARLR
jgi:hypothetical protein